MAEQHSPAWFARQEARLEEPLKNTVRYYTKREVAKMLSLAYCPPAGLVLFPWGLYNFLKMRKFIHNFSNLTTDFMNKGRAITSDGPPGSGKTFTTANITYILALEQWEKLKQDYFTQRTMVSQWVKNGDNEKLEAFRVLEQSFLYMAEREDEFIPCLISSTPLREYGTGRMSYKIVPEIFLQKERVAEYMVFFIDEIGEDQGVDKSDTGNPYYLAFWRYPRHFFDGFFGNTNQDGGQAAIAVRRSTDYNNHIFGQEWIFRPAALERRFKRKKKRYFKRLKKGRISAERAEYIGQKLYYLKKYIDTIGFRKVTMQVRSTDGVAINDMNEVVLPAIGFVQYDARAYRRQYRCKDQPIKMQGWEKLTIDEYDHSEFNNQVKGTSKP